VIFGARHLREDGLFECYLAEHCGESLEPPAAEHLTDCAECRARYGDLRRFMDALRTEANSELDEIFPPERQRAQQQQIARRVEHLGHHARVISFPGRQPGLPAPSVSSRVAHHWLGVAAAAGLVIGVGLGTAYYSLTPTGVRPAIATSRSIPESVEAPALAAAPAVVPALVSDVNEQFLSELELALERPHTSELVALDELTPHVREVRVQLR
jgi:anti-sigma factor RsiW